MTMDRDSADLSRPHVIRLRGPWQAAVDRQPGRADSTPRVLGRFQAPDGLKTMLPPDWSGRLTLRRSFHCPTGLSDRTRVLLEIESTHAGLWALNGTSPRRLTIGAFSAEIQSMLRPRNELCIELEIDGGDGMRQPICDVRLEIYGEKD